MVSPATIIIAGASNNVIYNSSTQTNTGATVSINGASATTISGTTVNTGIGSQSFTLSGYGSGTNASTSAYADSLALTAGAGTTASNYSISVTNGGLTIGRANLAITATASPTGNIYNGTAYTGTYTANFLGSDATHVTVSGIATGTDAGTYTSALSVANNSGYTVLSNYSPVITNANLVVSPKPVTITNTAASITYDGVSTYANLMSTAGITAALVMGDTIGSVTQVASISGIVVSGIAQAGSFTSTPSAAILSSGKASNYLFSYVASSSNTVAKADLAITALESLSGNTYTGSAYTGNYTMNAKGSDAASISVIGVATGINAGKYGSNLVVSGSGSVLSNYNSIITNADLVITPAPIGIQVTGQYNGSTILVPVSSVITGLVNGETLVISSATVNAKDVSSNSSNYVTAVLSATGTANLNNYAINTSQNGTPNTNTTNSATITPAPLVISASNSAKFVTQSDPSGYSGVIYNGWIGIEGSGQISGAPVISRSNSGVDIAGIYTLTPSGFGNSGSTNGNYQISYQTGSFTIVPAQTLLVTVTPTVVAYSATPNYSITAQYLKNDGSTIVSLNPSINAGVVTINDGINGKANFVIAPTVIGNGAIPPVSGSNNIVVGAYNLAAKNLSIEGGNFLSLVLSGSQTITPMTLTVEQLGLTSISKIYDGNKQIKGVTATISTGNVVVGDLVAATSIGTFNNANVGTGKLTTVNVSLSGLDAVNYALSTNSVSANIGTIVQLPSVQYVGSNNGLWSNANNWQDGAIPTLNNVANVIIPVGSTVMYDATNLIDKIPTSSININGSISFSGSNTFANALIGAGSVNQSGAGVLTITGNNSGFTGKLIVDNSTLIIGAANSLGDGVVISNNGSVGVANDVTLKSLVINTPDGVVGSSKVNLLTNITSLGSQIYNANVVITPSVGESLSLTSLNGPITFNGFIDSASNKINALNILASSGTVTLGDSVGSNASLKDLAVSAPQINILGDVLTSATQSYTGAVFIGDNGRPGFLLDLFKEATGLTPYILNNNTTNVRTFISKDPSVYFSQAFNDLNPGQHTVLIAAISPSPEAALLDKPSVPGNSLLFGTNVYSYALAAVITGDPHPEQYTNNPLGGTPDGKNQNGKGLNQDNNFDSFNKLPDVVSARVDGQSRISSAPQNIDVSYINLAGMLMSTIDENNNFSIQPDITNSGVSVSLGDVTRPLDKVCKYDEVKCDKNY